MQVDESDVKIVDTNEDALNGQDKCPKCGSTDISINLNKGLLRCNFCRHEFEPQKVQGLEEDVSKLSGEVIAKGAQDIIDDTGDIVTLKCSSCAAEVVIDTKDVTQARCHWCRNMLSINEQIPNGSVPDIVLPFSVKKIDAQKEIEKFVSKRNFYANPKFKKEFVTDNIMGVYFPYMVVDINAHLVFEGQGEHTARRYTKKQGDNYVTYYDADLYNVKREFDLVVNDLTVESSLDKLDKKADSKTTNIINSIMPFDIENAQKWNANYLRGFTSERRDTNVSELKKLVSVQALDIARFAANESLKHYDRGVAWTKEELVVKGEQWASAYLPVWLYSYQEVKGDKKLLHYVAVNARTKETMGSVPIHIPKLLFVSFIVEVFCFLAMIFIDFEYNWLFLIGGFIYYIIVYGRYRNSGARHKHELETNKEISNLAKVDDYIRQNKGVRNPMISGANNTKVNGSDITIKKESK